MSKYIFRKIIDMPYVWENQVENAYADPEDVRHSGKGEAHWFPFETVEQEDALRHLLMYDTSAGLTYGEIKNSEEYQKLSKNDKYIPFHQFSFNMSLKNKIDNTFDKSSSDNKETGQPRKEVVYYYSKALYDRFPNVNKKGESLEYGVIFVKNTTKNIPFTMFCKVEENGLGTFLRNLYLKIKGERNDLDFIENAVDNARIIRKEEKVGRLTFNNCYYDTYIKWILKEYYNQYFSKIYKRGREGIFSLEELIRIFDNSNIKTLYDYSQYIGNFANCNELESNNIRRMMFKCIEQNFKTNTANFIKEGIYKNPSVNWILETYYDKYFSNIKNKEEKNFTLDKLKNILKSSNIRKLEDFANYRENFNNCDDIESNNIRIAMKKYVEESNKPYNIYIK